MPRFPFVLLLLVTAPLIVGCEGCRQGDDETNAGGNEQTLAESFSTEPLQVYPTDQSALSSAVKPGHWMTAERAIRSNRTDTRGTLDSRTAVSIRNVDMQSTGMFESRESVRPVVLPKGQMRGFDFRFRCPIPNSIETRQINVANRLIPRSGPPFDMIDKADVMQASEYFFLVLTTRPERFTRFQVSNWAGVVESNLDRPVTARNYRVVVPDSAGLLPLPETMLDMTSIAVVFWDDVSEDALTPMQSRALADWIRFGGRFIINGPSASDAIANSALADLLPLYPTSNIELSSDAAAELMERWSVETDRSLAKQLELIRSESSQIAVDGRLAAGAEAIPDTASLILRHRFGRGHVIQPRFDLTASWLEAWASYDSFINGVILNRPPREYAPPSNVADPLPEELSLTFTGTNVYTDAAVNSRLRIAARDSILQVTETGGQPIKSGSRFDRFSRVDALTGLTAWNDDSDTITLMRSTLADQAGIEIPGSSMVVRALALYLVVLVPLNYLLFRLLNRLEYAWFAVPVIAVVGAALAARQARLDIGFARSNTELAILEAHSGYGRAHLTRLIGIYNSLSSRYDLQFKTVDGCASPLDNEPDPGTTVPPVFQTSFEEGPSLANFAVPSNRMRYVHTEQMIDLGGAIGLDDSGNLSSESDFELLDAMVVRRTADGEVQVAWVGGLQAGAAKPLEFQSTDQISVPTELPMQVGRLMRAVAQPELVASGESRLIARLDGVPEALTLSPEARQRQSQTVVIVHLQHQPLPEPKIDKNLVGDFRRVAGSGAAPQTVD